LHVLTAIKACHLWSELFWKYPKMGSVCIIETFCSSWYTRSALLVLRIVPSYLIEGRIITLPNIFVRTVLSKKGNHFTWPVYFLILKQLKCWIRMVC
jgi:hypothetical protein